MTNSGVPPGPRGHRFAGCLPEYSRHPLGFVAYCHREYGDIVSVPFPAFPRTFFLYSPDYTEELLVRNNRNFIKSRDARRALEVLGKGLLTNEGDEWLRQRRAIQPAFRHDRIESYASAMVACAERLVSEWGHGQTRNIHDDMMGLTVRIAAEALFDTDVTPESERVSSALAVTLGTFASGGNQLLILLPMWAPIPWFKRYRRAQHTLKDVTRRIIRGRRERPAGDDLLARMLSARNDDGSAMSDRQIEDEVLTLLLAGHETTALALSWTWFLLSKHPDVESRLRAELREVLGGRPPTDGDVPDLRFTEAVVKETMRLFPPAWAQGREALDDCEIGGYRIPAGSQLYTFQYEIHRDPRYFRAPHSFDPDRWLRDETGQLPRFAYFPFGGGPRVCIGSSFAMMEAVLLLAMIVPKFHLKMVPGQEIGLMPSITLRPRRGILAELQPPDAPRPTVAICPR